MAKLPPWDKGGFRYLDEIHRLMEEQKSWRKRAREAHDKRRQPQQPPERVLTEDLMRQADEAVRRYGRPAAADMIQPPLNMNELFRRYYQPYLNQQATTWAGWGPETRNGEWTGNQWAYDYVASAPIEEPQEMQEFDEAKSDFT